MELAISTPVVYSTICIDERETHVGLGLCQNVERQVQDLERLQVICVVRTPASHVGYSLGVCGPGFIRTVFPNMWDRREFSPRAKDGPQA